MSIDFRNHKGALDFPSAVDSYLLTELVFGSVCGPFARNPFSAGHMAVSPLNSVPKPDSDERLFILDLSWPAGASVNDGISKEFYLGRPVNLRYPMVDDIFSCIVQFASCCLLYKRDLKHAYRQLPVDPYDYPLLGYSCHDQLYFDVHLPMGQRSAAMACQRVTNAVCFMLSQPGCDILSYLDDFIGISAPSTAFEHYRFCGSLLDVLGLQESLHKACPPSTQMTCLGVLFDTVALTMSVTPDRLNQLQDELFPCDKEIRLENLSIVMSMNSERIFDKLLATCSREIWFLAAINEFELRTCHLSSSKNRGADLLSRWHLNLSYWQEFLTTYGCLGLQPVLVPTDLFQLSDTI